jgi:tellurite resistance protein
MREEDDKHAEMIHFLRNNTQLSRFSRAEVRDFIDRLDADGYEIVAKQGEPAPELEPVVIDV